MRHFFLKCSGEKIHASFVSGSHSIDDVYCWKCGLPLERWGKECPKCKAKGFIQVDMYCRHCGTELEEVKLPWKGGQDE